MPKVLYTIIYVSVQPSIASLLSVDPDAKSGMEALREFEFMNTVAAITKLPPSREIQELQPQ